MVVEKHTSIKIICPDCNNPTTMTYLEEYDIDEKNELDRWALNNTTDLINPDMEKKMYDICKKVVNDSNPKIFASISSIGKHRVGGLFSKHCMRSEKICKVFSYYFIDHQNQTGGFTFRLIEEMLPTSTLEQYGKLTFVSKNDVMSRKIDELMKNENYEEVIKITNYVLMTEPDNTVALFNKGDALSHLGYYEEAIAYCDKVLEIQPDSNTCLICKGVALRYLEKYDEAIACYDKALEIDSGDLAIWMNKGNVLWDLEKYDESIACYDKALEIDPVDNMLWMNKGNVLRQLKKYDEAIACYDKALELKPNDSLTLQRKNELKIELEKD